MKKTPNKMKPIAKFLEENFEEGAGKIEMIMACFVAGYTRKEIVLAGFNKSTVYHQVGDYIKLRNKPALQFQGYAVWEGRVRKLVSSNKVGRDKAIQALAEKDGLVSE
jgi:hypothetical protein